MTRFRLPGARQLAQWAKAGAHVLREQGPGALLAAAGAAMRREAEAAEADYAGWARDYATPTPEELAAMRRASEAMGPRPVVSVLLPVFDPPEALLRRALNSVIAQAWPHWTLCIADDASRQPHVLHVLEEYRQRDPRILVVRREVNGHIAAASNSALALATGEYVALLDHDDELSPDALFRMALEIRDHPDVALAYSDEDKLDPAGARALPHFKTDWNPELLLAHNFVAHLGVYRTDLVRQAGGFRAGFEGAQDHDLALRIAEQVSPARIRHVPRVLYHWRMTPGSTALATGEKDYAAGRARRAVEEHLQRRGIAASVEGDARLGAQRVRFLLPEPAPAVTVIVEGGALEAVKAATRYAPATFLAAGDRNALAHAATAEIVVFLGAGLVPLADDWLAELASQAVRRGVGAVGGRIVAADGTLLVAGLILGAGFGHRGRPRGDPGYMNRAELLQQVSAVTGDCLAVRRSLLAEHGGFDPALAWAFDDVDLCLRLEAAGERTIYAPHALLRREDGSPERPACEAEAFARFPTEAALLSARWGARLDEDPFYGPNFAQASPPFALARPPRVARFGEQAAPAGPLDGLSALVINYNTAPLTRRSTRSLLDAGVATVLVLDNASSPADVARLQADHAGESRVRILPSSSNLGFAAGSNLLIAEALKDPACRRVLLLNSDAFVVAEGLAACLRAMDEGGHALMGGRLLKPAAQGEPPVESLGIALYKSLLASNRKRTTDAYLGPTGGFAVYSRAFLEDVERAHGHVFDPSYFCYAEDSDLAIRARLLGHAAGYVDDVVAFHEGQGSHDEGRDAFILYHGIRNSLWMVAKSVPGRILLARLPWVVLLHGGIVLRHTVGGRIGTLWRLYRDAIAGLPAALRQRRIVQGTRRIAPGALAAFIDRKFYDPDYVKGALRALTGRGPLA